MKLKHVYVLIGVVAVLTRLWINFHIELIPGIGGGYNVIQIREVIENGHLAFSDMPLLFYLNAFLVKILSVVLPGAATPDLIIAVSKVLDSVLLPMLLIPFYLAGRDLPESIVPKYVKIGLAAFVVLSFAPLELTADAQKNAFGLALLMLFIYSYLGFLKYRKRKMLILSAISLLVIGLTHFGVFVISLGFLFTGLVVFYRRKAWVPIIISLIIALALVAIFDDSRSMTLLFFWKLAFGFPFFRLVYYPQGLINLFFTYFLIGLLIASLVKRGNEMPLFEKKVIVVFLIYLAFLSFPFYNFELGRRFNLMLFVPQVIAVLFLFPYIRKRSRIILFTIITAFVAGSFLYGVIRPKPMFIVPEAYEDMKSMGSFFKDPGRTIVFASHGLNWWVAWEHGTKVAEPHIPIDQDMIDKYDDILLLIQKKGRNKLYPGQTSPFINPEIPENGNLIYRSAYFDLYMYRK
ncbi:MAG: hypothetical protein K9J30_12030 [Bacteroidales bacterium]|nr:hypothetical protein [Bacteroidales bacterium]